MILNLRIFGTPSSVSGATATTTPSGMDLNFALHTGRSNVLTENTTLSTYLQDAEHEAELSTGMQKDYAEAYQLQELQRDDSHR